MKIKLSIYFALLALVSVAVYNIVPREKGSNAIIPALIGEEREGKNAPWSDSLAAAFYAEQENIQNALYARKNARMAGGAYADGSLYGTWQNRGPKNMPGAFQFCEMDEGTDTVYAVSCGHYGGVQFIWKGTLNGDDWKIINPKNPARFDDLIVIPNGAKRRVIAGKQGGGLMYSDDAGKNWLTPTGITGVVKSTIVNRQDNNVIYATTASTVFKSTDNGATFTSLQNFGANATNLELYSPRWASQPGATDVYLVRDTKVYKLNAGKTSFTQTNTNNPLASTNPVAMSGDSRRLWIVLNERKWYSSTDGGVTFTYVRTQSSYYGDPYDDMESGQHIGVNPENPDIVIGGYANPIIILGAGTTINMDASKYWGYYQNAVGNDAKVRNNYHPDFQAHHFFYDKTGKLMTLRASDGGIFRSYNEWTKSSFPTYNDMTGIYYNISLYNKPTQETYRGGFMYGYLSPDHLSAGTQDQGWQDVRSSTYGQTSLSWDQVAGGDGPSCITGDGKIGWSYNYQGTGEFTRIQLYSGTTFKGQTGTKSTAADFSFTGSSYFTPSVGDWQNGDRIWVLSQSLRRIEYNNGTITAKEDLFGTGSSYMQGVAQSRKTPDIVYAMRNGIVHKSTNRGTNWTQVASATATGITGFSENRGMGWSSPLDDKIVLFATQSGTAVKSIYSEDGGVTWTNVTGTGANQFPAAEVNGMAGSKTGKYVFASTNMGPYVFSVATKKWYPLATDEDMPIFWGQIVYCVDYGTKEVVHFSTWGQGVWDFTIEDKIINTDVGITNINVPSSVACGASVTPKVTIKNVGNDVLTSVKIKLYADNVLKQTLSHTTSLAKNATQEVTLSSLALNKNTTIKVVLELPNGVADEQVLDNELQTSISYGGVIPQNTISVLSFSTQETSGEGGSNGRAIHAIDNDPNTFWHSQWTGAGSVMPHILVFDLGNRYDVSSLTWLHRQNNSNGNTKTAKIYISEDGVAWGTGELITLQDITDLQTIPLTTKSGKYIKVEILSNFPGDNNSSLAEINFNGCIATLTSISSHNNQNVALKIYPNPASNYFVVDADNVTELELINTSGVTVKKLSNLGDNPTVDIATLKAGIYLVKIKISNKITTHRIIVE